MVARCLIQILVFSSGERRCLDWFCLLLKGKQWQRCQELRHSRVLSNLKRILFVISCLSARGEVLNTVCQLWPRAFCGYFMYWYSQMFLKPGYSFSCWWNYGHITVTVHIWCFWMWPPAADMKKIHGLSFAKIRYYCNSLTMINAKICWYKPGSVEVLWVLTVLFCQHAWAGKACPQLCGVWCREPWTAVGERWIALWEWRGLYTCSTISDYINSPCVVLA